MKKILSFVLCGALCSAFAAEKQKEGDTPDTPDTMDTDDFSDAEASQAGISEDFSSQSSWKSMLSFGIHAEAGAFQLKKTVNYGFYGNIQKTEKWNINAYGNVIAQARFAPVQWFSYVLGLGVQGEYAQRSSAEMRDGYYYDYYDESKMTSTLYEVICQQRMIFTIPQLSSDTHFGFGADAIMSLSEDSGKLKDKNAIYGYGFLEVSYTININNMNVDVGIRGGALLHNNANYEYDVEIKDFRAGIFADVWLF